MNKKTLAFSLIIALILTMVCGCSFTNDKTTIVKNAKVYTSDKNNPLATAFAVKDGKFVYVGDEEGLKNYDGEVIDLGGKTVIPSFIDAHIHLPQSLVMLSFDNVDYIEETSKEDCLKHIKDVINKNPNSPTYTFIMSLACLGEEQLVKEDLDKICSDKEVFIIEQGGHSSWSNSLVLKNMGINDDTPDMAKGCSFYVRDDKGHITGEVYEGPHFVLVNRHQDKITDEEIEEELTRWVEYCKEAGVSAVFEAGTPGSTELTERAYDVLCKMDKEGKLPIYVEGSYPIYDPAKAPEAIQELVRQNKKYNTEHIKVDTLKVFLDGTINVKTASMVTPYTDDGTIGGTIFNSDEIAMFLNELNELGFNFHAHCVGEGAVKTVLDATEIVKGEIGDDFESKVTIAHNMLVRDEDIPRFKELGVIANYTPWWFSGAGMAGGIERLKTIFGDRAYKMFRAKSVWDSGALVAWSSDNTEFEDFSHWNPMLGMEVGMTRQITKDTKLNFNGVGPCEQFPDKSECMSIEEMILGYTINAATQLGLDDEKGSIEEGKDADYIVFDKDLLNENPYEFSQFSPKEVWFGGKLVHEK